MTKASPSLAFFVLVILSCALGGTLAAQSADRPDQRRLGEEVLLEALLGPRQLLIRVATGGCTGKDSFKVDVAKAPGPASQTAHYVLTVNRIKIDSCKAFFPDGTPVLLDLEKDLGLKGGFTYSVSNRVVSGSGGSDNSFFGIVKKYFLAK